MKKKLIAGNASRFALVAALALAWALSAQVQAQNANDQAATAQNGAAGADTLQEVVVTAERRAVSLQSTPIDVQVIEGDQLQSQHLSDIPDLESTVPGFQSASQGGTSLVNNIRGLGTVAVSGSVQPGVKIIRDGVVQDTYFGLEQALYDEADVEVLEGPQGTFVGSSAIAGAVEENSQNPNFNGFGGYVLAGAGNYMDLKFQGAVNLPVSDTFALRLAFNVESADSFYEDIGDTLAGFYYTSYSATNPASDGAPKGLTQGSVGTGQQIDPGSTDARSFRLKALWKPTDNFQSLSELEYSTDVTGGETATPNPTAYQNLFSTTGCTTQLASINFPGATGNQFLCPQAGVLNHTTYYYPGERPFVLDYYGTAYEYTDFEFQLSEEMRYTLPDGIVLRSLSSLWHLEDQMQDDPSFGPQDAGFTYHPNGPDPFISQELDVISPTTGKVNWIGGAWWEYRGAPVPSTSLAVPNPYQPDTLPTTYSESASGSVDRVGGVFGQLNWQFTDTLQLQTGARWNWDNNAAENPFGSAPPAGTLLAEPNGPGSYSISYTAAACGTITPPCYKVTTPSVNSGHYTDSVPTGKADLNWTPLPGQNFYLFYARGYSGGGVNATSPDHPVFVPETVNDWEAGWKGRVLDGHMLTQVGFYYERLQNFQYTLEDLETNNDTAIGSYIANFAPSSIQGVSIAEQSRFGGLGVDLAFDYNHTSLGSVLALNTTALPGGFGTPQSYPQCLPNGKYGTTQATIECFNYTPYLTNVGGEETPDAPDVQLHLAVDYLFHVGVGTLDPRVTYAYTAKQYEAIYQNPYTELPIRHLLGATLDWVVGKWDTQIWGTNLTNQLYIDGNSGGDVFYGAPRQFGIQGKYTF